jgi:signal peptidase I
MKLELRNDIFFAEVERMISEGQSVTIPVKGFSMRPMMRSEKDKVILTAHSDNDIKQRAVMLFRHNGHHIMHRIVKIEGQNITFAGDGNYRIREQATKDDIVAQVTAIIRPSGHVILLDSRRWRIYSTLWLALPKIVRRFILGLTNKLRLWI